MGIRWHAAALLSALLLSACGPVPEAQDEGGPLTGLPACPTAPEAGDVAPVDGLVLPDGAVVTAVEEGDPLTTVHGYVPTTPIEVRRYYQRRPGLELFEIEDEVFEAEALLSTGSHRMYVKAQAVCAKGSQLIAVVADEVGGAALPTPQRLPQPSEG